MSEDSIPPNSVASPTASEADAPEQTTFAVIADAPLQPAPPKPHAPPKATRSHPFKVKPPSRQPPFVGPPVPPLQPTPGRFGLLVAALSAFPAIFGPTAKIIDIVTSYGKLLTASREIQLAVALIITAVAGYVLFRQGILSRLVSAARSYFPFAAPITTGRRALLLAILIMANVVVISVIYDYISFSQAVADWTAGTTITTP